MDGAGRAVVPLIAVVGAMVSLLLFLLARAHVRHREREWHTTRETAALASQVQARNTELAAASKLNSEFLATSGKHLLGLIDDILDLSRIETNRLSVSHAPARVEKAVDAAIGFLRPQARAKGVALETRCDSPDDLYLGDERRVQQILTNLLANAVKFTPAGGMVTLRCDHAAELPPDTEAPASGPWICFTVEDIGVGIAPAQQQRIFQPFVQGDSGYTRTHGGAGLGLTISRRLARLRGGELSLESVVGEGTDFTLWLPAAAHEAPPTHPRAELAERS